jgi:hypothetical protein
MPNDSQNTPAVGLSVAHDGGLTARVSVSERALSSSRLSLQGLVEKWRKEADQHEQKAETFEFSGRPDDARRRRGEASVNRKCADDLASLLPTLQIENEKEDQSRMDTMGESTDNLTAPPKGAK